MSRKGFWLACQLFGVAFRENLMTPYLIDNKLTQQHDAFDPVLSSLSD